MKTKPVEIKAIRAGNGIEIKSFGDRFVVFVAGGKRPIISFPNFSRAEGLAIKFAASVNVRMEVFDSFKETCYFIEPFEPEGSLVP